MRSFLIDLNYSLRIFQGCFTVQLSRLVANSNSDILSCIKSFVNNFFIYFRVVCDPNNFIIISNDLKFVNNFLINLLNLKMSTLNSTFFHIFIVLPFCTIRSLFYCIFSLLGSAIVRLPLLPASHAPYFRSYASCFTSSSNSSPAE